MLNIELDSVSECCNPACREEIAPPDEQHRFCPRCGAAQVFECEACPTRPGALLRVADDPVCPRCGAVYVLCARCRYPLQVTNCGPLTCPDGCGAGLTEARGGWAGELGGVARTGSVFIRPQATDVGAPQTWSFEEPVASPVCRFGRLYALTARGVVRCLDEESGQDVKWWRPVSVAPAGAAPLEGACLQVSERFLWVGWGGNLVACSVTDGEEAFRIHTELQDVRWAAWDDRLLLVGKSSPNVLRAELRDAAALCRGEEGLLQAHDFPAASASGDVNCPAAMPGAFFFTDLQTNLWTIDASGEKEFAPLWTNQGYEYISAPAVQQERVWAVVHSRTRGAALLRLPLVGAAPEARHLEGITPAYLGPRFTRRQVCLFDDASDSFRVYDLSAPAAQPRSIFLGETLTGDQTLVEFMVLEDPRSRGAWIVSLDGTPGALKPRMVHTETPDQRPTIGGCRVGSLALAASDRRLFICDVQSGEVLVHHIPKV